MYIVTEIRHAGLNRAITTNVHHRPVLRKPEAGNGYSSRPLEGRELVRQRSPITKLRIVNALRQCEALLTLERRSTRAFALKFTQKHLAFVAVWTMTGNAVC